MAHDVTLGYILDRLRYGDISIINFENKNFIANKAMQLYQIDNSSDPSYAMELRDLIFICNILYNRTDMQVLPVEDGLYDILLERYKTLDPAFQVGSFIVDFGSTMMKENINTETKQIVQPVRFLDKNKDETRLYFEQQLLRFDRRDVLNHKEVFREKEIIQEQYISKRTHDTAHNHPDLVGTLDKCKFVLDKDAIEKDAYNDDRVKILERDWFVKHINEGIITPDQELEMVIELKYDGISVEADCTDQVLSARTRGDTGIGQASDITPLLYGYKFLRNDVLKDRVVGVKFEAIMTKANLQKFNIERQYNYVNCRSAIVGLFGASDGYKYRDYITLVPLALDRDNVPEVKNRMEEIELLNTLYKTNGEPLRYCYIKGNYQTCLYLIKKFAEEAVVARNYLGFMFDGIVVSYLDENIRARLGRENFINKYQMAVKFDPLCKQTTFLEYTFEVGQTGAICPMIHYAPVEFFGTIHPKSTGSSYKRFKELGLKQGDIIEVTYTNDVMPYVTSIDCETNRQNPNPLWEFPEVCPVCGTKLIFGDKTATCPNLECFGRKTARMTNMLQKLNITGFAEATINQLGIYSFNELFTSTKERLSILGPGNSENLYEAMTNLKRTPIEDYRLIGSLGFTNIGAKKWKLVFSEMTLNDFVNMMDFEKAHLYTTICNIRGLGEKTADIIINEYPYYEADMRLILKEFNIINSKDVKMSGKVIRFTGCRDKQLELWLREMGHDADGSASVTKSTDILLVPYEGFSSTKLNKIGENTIVVSLGEFNSDPSKYL